MPDDLKRILTQFKEVKSARMNFDSYYQTLHDIFYVEAENINKAYYPGTELDFTDLYDTQTLQSADVLAAGITNYLTPATSRWFGLRTKNPNQMESKAVSTYLKDVESEVYHTLNRSNFYNTIPEFFKGSGVYGTQTMLTEEDDKEVMRFYTLPIKRVWHVMDGYDRVGEYYISFEYTAFEAVTKFGEENLSKGLLEDFKEHRNPDKKYEFLLYIYPRSIREAGKYDNKNMPIAACWIQLEGKGDDSATKVSESGYQEMPAFTHRFYTRPGVAQGYSPAMKALPNARYLNVMAETILRSGMKMSDPAYAIPDNAFVLPFNQNPGALNYYNRNKLKADDIFPLGTNANPKLNMEMMLYQAEQLRGIMFTDVFLAFQGLTKQMTVPEVQERIAEKMTLLGPAVGRYLSDVLSPTIHRVILALDRQEMLPPMPQELLNDPRYEIEFVSALARAQKMGELNTLTTALNLSAQIAQVKPEALDKIDADAAVDVIWGITGADVSIIRDKAEVLKIRQARMKQEAIVAETQMAAAGAEITEKVASSEQKIAQARAAGVGV
jgi:hypothetical protein